MADSGASLSAIELFDILSQVRETRPLVHNITNFVAMNFTANVLLALGASPLMAHAEEELPDIVGLSHSLVINMGTLDREWVQSMNHALNLAVEKKKPAVFDPVGAGASAFRTGTALKWMEKNLFTALRGNASEILALAGSNGPSKGVDSLASSSSARETARHLARRCEAVICVSGETDYVVDASRMIALKNGHPLMTQVTAMGCAATSVIGAFLGVHPDPFEATTAAMATLTLAGEKAAEKCQGPGSFQVAFLDELHALKPEDFTARLRLSVVK